MRSLMQTYVYLVMGLIILNASPAMADEYRTGDLIYGQQAMGMGGAVVARPTNPTASFYNPAGLAFLSRSTFSGSMHFFGKETVTLHEGLRSEGLAGNYDSTI